MLQSPCLLFPPFFLASLHYWLLASYSTLEITTGYPLLAQLLPGKSLSQQTDPASRRASARHERGERGKKRVLKISFIRPAFRLFSFFGQRFDAVLALEYRILGEPSAAFAPSCPVFFFSLFFFFSLPFLFFAQV